MNILQAMQRRKSVRTYAERPLSAADRQAVLDIIDRVGAQNPFGTSQKFWLLDPAENKLTSPVLVGNVLFVGGKCRREPLAEVAFGYVFETMMLEFVRLGLGTVWLAGTIKRPLFETAMEVSEDEMMPAVTPIGYPAAHCSLREKMMRKGIKADHRQPFGSLFFSGGLTTSLRPETAGGWAEAMEAVRWAPSAANSQPWRLVVEGEHVHFIEKKRAGFDRKGVGDIQKCDIGIAMAHFELTLSAAGIHGSWQQLMPAITLDSDMEYIISFVKEGQIR
ncbi:MAG: nitroreductase family protein [Lachnospiraceae bacterium]|nr:nitroreductase family protein [Lachnospiraceae bacterium]MDY5742766.1 nitroreductase family protein [Lachnospiraceae bacterium]